ncbi:MAG: thermonuclease family protein [Patescibacteria group bacterium]|jgi:micrococcal nuclease
MNKRLLGFVFTLFLSAVFGVGLLLSNEAEQPTLTDPMPDPNASANLCEVNGFCAPRTTSTIETNAIVVRVVDGDTLSAKMDGESEEQKIRLLGINTPETVDPRRPVECFGKQASARLKELVEGKRVRFEADPEADERDKYDRLLRNVFLADGTDVNALMVHDGFAYAYLSFPLNRERRAELRTLEELAKASSSGLWSPETCKQPS